MERFLYHMHVVVVVVSLCLYCLFVVNVSVRSVITFAALLCRFSQTNHVCFIAKVMIKIYNIFVFVS